MSSDGNSGAWGLRPIVWFAAASMVTTILHELAHACAAFALGVRSTLFNYSADLDLTPAQAATNLPALIRVAGPVFCLGFGMLSWLAFRRLRGSAAEVPLLYLSVFGIGTFFGNLMSTSFVGDFSAAAVALRLPDRALRDHRGRRTFRGSGSFLGRARAPPVGAGARRQSGRHPRHHRAAGRGGNGCRDSGQSANAGDVCKRSRRRRGLLGVCRDWSAGDKKTIPQRPWPSRAAMGRRCGDAARGSGYSADGARDSVCAVTRRRNPRLARLASTRSSLTNLMLFQGASEQCERACRGVRGAKPLG
jgi:hypothetical protein